MNEVKRPGTQARHNFALTGKFALALSMLPVLLVFVAACASSPTPAIKLTPISDKLAEIMARGTIIIASATQFPPQAKLKENVDRAGDTRCDSDHYTANQLEGFDVDVAMEIARQMGLEACFLAPAWTQITSGGWSDRWDISVGSMTITPDRMKVLYFTQPYYVTPAALFVHQDNTTLARPGDLSGKRVGVTTSSTNEFYLQGSLVIPGQEIHFLVKNPIIEGYNGNIPAVEDLARGDGVRLDAILVAEAMGQDLIKQGQPLKQLGEPVFYEYLAVAVDKSHSEDPVSLVQKVTEIIQQMHQDGALSKFAARYYNGDVTTAAGQFDFEAIKQFP